jgi:hypothetical protein
VSALIPLLRKERHYTLKGGPLSCWFDRKKMAFDSEEDKEGIQSSAAECILHYISLANDFD